MPLAKSTNAEGYCIAPAVVDLSFTVLGRWRSPRQGRNRWLRRGLPRLRVRRGWRHWLRRGLPRLRVRRGWRRPRPGKAV